jgi:hypothetical protein
LTREQLALAAIVAFAVVLIGIWFNAHLVYR